MDDFQKKIDYYIYLLLLGYMLVDCITGYFRMIGIPGISQPYKMIILTFMVIALRTHFGTLIYFYLFSTILLSLCIYSFNTYTSISNSLTMQLRIIMAPIIFIYIKSIIKKYKYRIIKIIKINTFVLLINLILGILGFGDSTYKGESNIGIKGFFYDGNALAAIVFVLYVIWINLYKEKKYLISLLFLVFGFFIGTKVSILSIILYFSAYSFLDVPKRKRPLVIIILAVLLASGIYFAINTPIFQYQYNRITYLLKLFNGNWLTVFLSGRDLTLIENFNFYKEKFSISQFLFGYGYLNFTKIIELDLFDTFLSYGLLFFFVIQSFYIYCIYLNRNNPKIIVFNLIYLLLSVTSGHIWFNPQVALFFSIANLIFLNTGDEYGKNIINIKHVPIPQKSYIWYFCKTNI